MMLLLCAIAAGSTSFVVADVSASSGSMASASAALKDVPINNNDHLLPRTRRLVDDEVSTHAYLDLAYCYSNDCQGDDYFVKDDRDWNGGEPNFWGLNYCDTIRGYNGGQWPIWMAKTRFWSDNTAMRVEFFPDDYCTGAPAATFMAQTGGGDDGNWYDVQAFVKSVRVYNINDFPDEDYGVGLKLIFFPWTGMTPYSEFPCRPWMGQDEDSFKEASCTEETGYCNQLDGRRSPSGGPNGDCVSSDDLIWAPDINDENYPYGGFKMVGRPISDWLDFAGQTCGDGYDYMCSFDSYPVGSIYYNLWFSTANGRSYPTMDGYCRDQNTNGMCVYTRFWKSDTTNPPENGGWWSAYPFVEAVAPLDDLCYGNPGERGYMHSICADPGDPDGSGAPMWWVESETERWIYGDDGTNWDGKPMPCSGGDLWPLWTSTMAQHILPCPSSVDSKRDTNQIKVSES